MAGPGVKKMWVGQQELVLGHVMFLSPCLVVNIDGDEVALARVDGWPREPAVHGEDALLLAEPGVVSFLYPQVKKFPFTRATSEEMCDYVQLLFDLFLAPMDILTTKSNVGSTSLSPCTFR